MVLIALADRLAIWRARRPASAAVEPVPDRPGRRPRRSPRAEPDARRRLSAPGAASSTPGGRPRAARAVADPDGVHARHGRPAPRPDPPVARLTGLFEIARFSDRALGTDARNTACDCLDEITTRPHTARAVPADRSPRPILVRCARAPWHRAARRRSRVRLRGAAVARPRGAAGLGLRARRRAAPVPQRHRRLARRRGASGLDAARGCLPSEPGIPLRFLDLVHDVRAALRSRRHFEKVLWPRLMSLAPRPPSRPASRPGRGPSLASLREVIAVIEKRP